MIVGVYQNNIAEDKATDSSIKEEIVDKETRADEIVENSQELLDIVSAGMKKESTYELVTFNERQASTLSMFIVNKGVSRVIMEELLKKKIPEALSKERSVSLDRLKIEAKVLGEDDNGGIRAYIGTPRLVTGNKGTTRTLQQIILAEVAKAMKLPLKQYCHRFIESALGEHEYTEMLEKIYDDKYWIEQRGLVEEDVEFQFSNFEPCKLDADDISYPNLENAYQAHKLDSGYLKRLNKTDKKLNMRIQFLLNSVGLIGIRAQQIINNPKRTLSKVANPGKVKELLDKMEGYGLIRPDREWVKVNMMFELLYIKCVQNPEFLGRLLAARDEDMIELNTRGDVFWGESKIKEEIEGENYLWRILVTLKKHFQESPELGTKAP